MEDTPKETVSHLFVYSSLSVENSCNYQANYCNYTLASLNYNTVKQASKTGIQEVKKEGLRYLKSKESNYFSTQPLCLIKELMNNKKQIKQQDKDLLIRIDSYIVNNYMNEYLRIIDIAQNAYSSVRKLQSKCKQLAGLTPYNLLIQYRLYKTACLLCMTDRQISLIAVSCGFAESSSFYRLFKRYFGVTPMCYRKMARIHNKTLESISL